MKNFVDRRNPVRYIVSLVLANIVLAAIVSLVFFEGMSRDFSGFMVSMVWGFVICITQWLGHSYIYGLLDRRFPWEEYVVKRAVINSLAIIVYSVFAYLVVSLILIRLFNGEFPDNTFYWALKSSYNAIFVSFAVCIAVVSVGFFKNWKSSLLEAERLKGEMLRYKYESLQNQINPHFLFNSFNVLSDLVYEDQKKAVTFIKQMSQLFRYVLDSRDKEFVPLAEELEFITSFAFLMQTRFEEKLIFQMNMLAEQDELIVPMTLQLLIENCVKHNEISASKPLQISVSRNGEFIEVKNNLQLKKSGSESTTTGLSNIVQQYGYFTDKQILIHSTDQFYSVKVPILKANKK